MKGGFKVLINGRIERCNAFSVDFDEAKFINAGIGASNKAEDFDRKTFAVMTITSKDMEIK